MISEKEKWVKNKMRIFLLFSIIFIFLFTACSNRLSKLEEFYLVAESKAIVETSFYIEIAKPFILNGIDIRDYNSYLLVDRILEINLVPKKFKFIFVLPGGEQ